MFDEKIIKILEKEMRKYDKPLMMNEKNPFRVLISCILSIRTRDNTTQKASLRLYKLADNVYDMSKLSLEKIENAIYPVGFFKMKSRNIKKICKTLLEKYKGIVPNDFNKLMELKGVGRKTANIVMVFGFKKYGLPIDTHCHRIPNRLGWLKTKKPEQTEYELKKILPKKYWKTFNTIFVTFGQNICKPIKPKCYTCPVKKFCKYGNKF